MKRIGVLLLVLSTATARGQLSSTEIGGYIKYLLSRTDLPSTAPSYGHLLHARLNTKWFPSSTLSGVLELRGRAYYGGIVEDTPDFANSLKSNAGFGSLGSVLWVDRKSVGYGEIDRVYLNWAPDRWQATLGRQRIAWGTNLVWNPIDLFNPQSVLDFDYEERPATDAARLQYYTSEVSKVELAVKPGTATSPAITGGQVTLNRWDYDFHFLGGSRSGQWFAGLGWAGDILGGGFRGELLTSGVPLSLRRSPSSDVMVSTAVSGDYTFPSSFYIHTEVMFNSEGVTSEAALARLRAQSLGLLSPARWSLYQEFSYDVTPLVRASVFTLANPSDGSFVIFPSATWSVVTDLDLTAIALIFGGPPRTEFGGQGTSAFVRIKWSY